MTQPAKLCENCKTKPAIIEKGRFVKRLLYCSEYCKSKHELKNDILFMIIAALIFGGFDLSIPGDTVHPIFIWSFIIIMTIDLYLILKNYMVIRNHNLHDSVPL